MKRVSKLSGATPFTSESLAAAKLAIVQFASFTLSPELQEPLALVGASVSQYQVREVWFQCAFGSCVA